MSLKEWYHTINNASLTFEPGTEYAYAITNYNLLGMPIEQVSGLTFDYEQPIAIGTIPAGYFLSNIEDMGQWIEIQLGIADIPEEYKELIVRSHELDTKRNAYGNDNYYSHLGTL